MLLIINMIVKCVSSVRTALNIDFQYFTKQAPNFTPENVKLGVLFYSSTLLRGEW